MYKRFKTRKLAREYRILWEVNNVSLLTGHEYSRIIKMPNGDGTIAWVIQYTWNKHPFSYDQLHRGIREWRTILEDNSLGRGIEQI